MDQPACRNRSLWLCEPEWSAHLRAELRQEFAQLDDQILSPGIISGRMDLSDLHATPSIALARQALPNVEALTAESIAAWGELIGQKLIERIPEGAGNWRLHLIGGAGADAPRPGRLKLIDEALDDFLRRKQRRLRRTRAADPAAAWSEAPILAQAFFSSPTRGYLSVCLADEREKLRRMLSRHPGGIVPPAVDKSAPSRAFAKLVEALDEWGTNLQTGDRVVDLGASPGSWTWLALEQGANVVAIDRSPLREDLMSEARCEFLSGDAFAYEPPQPVDWLLSDLIAFPERIIELLEKWLRQGWCRQFCVTIKFRGDEDYPRLMEIKRLLGERAGDFLLRRLNANKNEVTAVGKAK